MLQPMRSGALHGIQLWFALPADQEEYEPACEQVPAASISELDIEGTTARVIMGEAYGYTSPVKSYSPTVYLEYRLPMGASIKLPQSYRELAAYVIAGNVRIDQRSFTDGIMAVLRPGTTLYLEAEAVSHVLIIGGDTVGERHTWWNFVSSSAKRIERAKVDWKEDGTTKITRCRKRPSGT